MSKILQSQAKTELLLSEWLRNYEMSRRMEPAFRRDMERLAKSYGLRLMCLDTDVKSPDSFLDKCQRKMDEGLSPSVSDAVRFTVLCTEEGPQTTAEVVIDGLRKAGYLICEVDDKFAHPTECGYMGIHVHAIAHGGGRFEVQVHTATSLKVRERVHPMYEVIRDRKCGRKERARNIRRMRQIYQTISIP